MPSWDGREADAHDGPLLADCRCPPWAASWKPDEHGDADLGIITITEGRDPRRADLPSAARQGLAPWRAESRQRKPVYLSNPARQTYFTSRNSSRPYFEPSRPRPDCLTPPNGASAVEIKPVLTPTMPDSSRSATRMTRPMSR